MFRHKNKFVHVLIEKCEYLEYNIYCFLAKINDIIGSGSWTWSKMSGLNTVFARKLNWVFFLTVTLPPHIQYQT